MTKLQARDAKEKIALEWRLVALSIDRLFFVIYLLTIVVAMTTIGLICFLYSDPNINIDDL
jgi:nicotinic acetylcholine receptor